MLIFSFIYVFMMSCQQQPCQNNNFNFVYTQQLQQKGLREGDDVFIRIFKEEKLLEIWMRKDNQWVLALEYQICNFSGGLGHKDKEGDKKSPEGFYQINSTSLNPNSNYHLAMNIGYPNQYDKANGKTGSYIMIHGACVSVGCYAMTDEKIEEIYHLVEKALSQGQKTIDCHIFPFRMSEDKLLQYSSNEYYSFWKNIKEGYDIFEKTNQIPKIEVQSKKYTFK